MNRLPNLVSGLFGQLLVESSLAGIVVDENGQPISDVQLRVRDAATSNQPDLFANNADGKFELRHLDAATVLITAEKPGYQIKGVTVVTGDDVGPTRIVLAQAKPLLLRVLGESGEPVDAEVMSDDLLRELRLANQTAPTSLGDSRTLSGADDQALLTFGQAVTELFRAQSVPAFLNAATLSRPENPDFFRRAGWGSAESADET